MGRGQSVRYLQLADMWVRKLENEGATPCYAMGITSKQGKCNKVGRAEYSGAMRHRDVNLCTVGAVAIYLFYRFHVEGETPPDTSRNDSWYDTFFMKADPKRQKQKKKSKCVDNTSEEMDESGDKPQTLNEDIRSNQEGN